MKFPPLNFINSLIFIFLLSMAETAWSGQTQEQSRELWQQYRLTVAGLKCRSCIPDVRKSLETVDGVRKVKILKFDKAGSDVAVEIIPGSVSGEELVGVLRASGFQAEIASVSQPREVVIKKKAGFGFLEML